MTTMNNDDGDTALRVGKLPPELLAQLLAQAPASDPSVLIGARIGEDAALIDTGGENYLVVTSDPVTFATEELGRYAVHVNANDIAAMGGAPRWLMMTLILPDGSPSTLAQGIMLQTIDACAEIGVTLIGGHTEVTRGIDRPIAVGTMIGEVLKGAETPSSAMRPGNAIVLTGGVGIEGTAILAREAAGRLRSAGVSDDAIRRAANLLHNPGISVVRHAAIATQAAQIHAMHDPTEGGVATALHEMADASGVGLLIDSAALIDMTLPETAAICRALTPQTADSPPHSGESRNPSPDTQTSPPDSNSDPIDPLGLIASGALLICTRSDRAATVVATLEQEGIRASVIGHATERADGLNLTNAGPTRHSREGGNPSLPPNSIPLPRYNQDELARILSG